MELEKEGSRVGERDGEDKEVVGAGERERDGNGGKSESGIDRLNGRER